MGDSNADHLSGSRRLETVDHTPESGDADVASATWNADRIGRGENGDGDDVGEPADGGAPDEHPSIRLNDRCATCNEYIGPRAYRLSRVIDTAVATLEIHYCSESCFLARDRPAGSSADDQDPDGSPAGAKARGVHLSEAAGNDSRQQDWSYCR